MDSLLCSHEAQDGENHKTSKEAGTTVYQSQHEGISIEERRERRGEGGGGKERREGERGE